MDLEFVIGDLQDLETLPSSQSSTLESQYQLIAADEKLSKKAIDRCEQVFQLWSSNRGVRIETIKRFKQLWSIIKDRDYPLVGFPYPNVTAQQVDVDQYMKHQREKSMKNLTVEEVEITDYV
ncbi:nucleolar protein swm2 [Zygosaccharomyces mellis]|uniref:Nucleolar protein SWM2 n=1 Tax=Zygosaccharomyces mellis TaxID=42258 RepID=A0A4C2EBE8_9SACH|nr:nucleolar protein swm2 [Zygosaccharomyces mellis]